MRRVGNVIIGKADIFEATTSQSSAFNSEGFQKGAWRKQGEEFRRFAVLFKNIWFAKRAGAKLQAEDPDVIIDDIGELGRTASVHLQQQGRTQLPSLMPGPTAKKIDVVASWETLRRLLTGQRLN